MNKIVGLSLVAAVVIGIIPYARSGDAPSVPPGVSARNWVPMGEQAGFVVTSSGNDLRNGLRSEPNVLKGYFMLRHDGVWVRVEPGPAQGLYPTEFRTVK
jgi:hypothetical protein